MDFGIAPVAEGTEMATHIDHVSSPFRRRDKRLNNIVDTIFH